MTAKTPLSRKNAANTRGKPFQKGNSGRPKGARNKATLAVQALLDGEAEALTRKAVELALEGDMAALRLCLERLCPPRRDRAVQIKLPLDDLEEAMSAIIAAAASGAITPSEAQALSGLIETKRRVTETGELERRVAALETEKEGKRR